VDLAKSCDYGVRGLLYLARRSNPFEPVLLRDIAARTDAPEAFLSKVFQSLRASNLVESHRGRKRGYSLARPPQEISLYDIIVATEGPARVRSVPSRAASRSADDPFRSVWKGIEDQIIEMMQQTTLRTILEQAGEGRM